MIEANELIINRYFELNGLIVRAIDFDGLNSLYNDIKYLKPIPLTEEWLLKFGFENGIDEMTLCNDKICIYWRKFENNFEINGEKYFIKELHKLQNLYFALTNEELTLNK